METLYTMADGTGYTARDVKRSLSLGKLLELDGKVHAGTYESGAGRSPRYTLFIEEGTVFTKVFIFSDGVLHYWEGRPTTSGKLLLRSRLEA